MLCILGTYKRINPTLQQPSFYRNICCHELDRKTITRYRVGCHYLKIQSGRLAGNDRNTRICTCHNEVQTLAHVLFDCPLTETIRASHNQHPASLNEFFSGNDYIRTASTLKAIEKQLKIWHSLHWLGMCGVECVWTGFVVVRGAEERRGKKNKMNLWI